MVSVADQSLVRQFKCVRCSVSLKDVKLLKLHYWQVHIPKQDIYDNMKVTDTLTLTPDIVKSEVSRKRKLTDGGEETAKPKQAKRKNQTQQVKEESMDDSMKDTDSTFNSSSLSEKTLETLNMLNKTGIQTFNLTKDVDEAKLIEKFKGVNKIPGFKEGQIVWAYYRNKYIWPSRIVRLIKSKKGSINKISIVYFEFNNKKSKVFKVEPSKVTAFFADTDAHAKFKQISLDNVARRFEFMSCYSDALNEFNDLLEKNEGLTEKDELKDGPKYFVIDKMLNKDKVIQLAKAEPTEDHVKTVAGRQAYSQRLLDMLNSEKCQSFIISILTNSVKCERNTSYLEGTNSDRKIMKFCSPGPLVANHQKELAGQLEHLQITHFPNKPANLSNYVYDVVYPEAVIWAIQKLETCTYKKAELKYMKGFQQTNEEIMKQRCNELLVTISEEVVPDESVISVNESCLSLSLGNSEFMDSEFDTALTDTMESMLNQIAG